MAQRSRKKPESLLRIARERINILFEQAEKTPEKADRYVQLARKLAMRYNVRIPRELKRRFCKHCYKYFGSKTIEKQNAKTGLTECTCKACGKVTRFGDKGTA